MSKIEKYTRTNADDVTEVAVLISGGFGAGWSTWNSDSSFLLFDKGLVELAMNEATAEAVEEYLEGCGLHNVYLGGWEQIKVVWLPLGTKFRVDEFDGSESLITLTELTHTA